MPPLSKIDLRTPAPLVPVAPVWTLAFNNQLTVPPAYDETRAYISIEGDRIVAYDLISGIREWIVSAHPKMEPVAGDGLLFLIEPDTLTALHTADGSIAWQLPFTEKLVVRPVWDNGWLIMASERGEIGAIRASDGKLIWRRDINSPAHAAPALASDRVYVPTSDRRIVALQVETGEPVWERRPSRIFRGARQHPARARPEQRRPALDAAAVDTAGLGTGARGIDDRCRRAGGGPTRLQRQRRRRDRHDHAGPSGVDRGPECQRSRKQGIGDHRRSGDGSPAGPGTANASRACHRSIRYRPPQRNTGDCPPGEEPGRHHGRRHRIRRTAARVRGSVDWAATAVDDDS